MSDGRVKTPFGWKDARGTADGRTLVAEEKYRGLSTQAKPAGVPIDSEYWEYDTNKIYRTYDGTNWTFIRGAGTFLATKTSSSPLTTGTIFNLTGSIQLLSIHGRVTTVIQSQATTVQLSVQADSLTIETISSAGLDINAFAVGSMISPTGTYTDAMLGTTGKPTQPPMTAINVTCVTSGIIKVTYGAASTGAIAWEVLWIPLNASGSVVAA